jgi:hypothetical protein
MNIRRFSRSPTPPGGCLFSHATPSFERCSLEPRCGLPRRPSRAKYGEEVHAWAFNTPYLTSSIYHKATCKLLFDPIEVPYKMAVPTSHHHVSLWISLLAGSFPYVRQCPTRVSIIKIGLTCPQGRLHDETNGYSTQCAADRVRFVLFHSVSPTSPTFSHDQLFALLDGSFLDPGSSSYCGLVTPSLALSQHAHLTFASEFPFQCSTNIFRPARPTLTRPIHPLFNIR